MDLASRRGRNATLAVTHVNPLTFQLFCIAALHKKCFTKRSKYEHIASS